MRKLFLFLFLIQFAKSWALVPIDSLTIYEQVLAETFSLPADSVLFSKNSYIDTSEVVLRKFDRNQMLNYQKQNKYKHDTNRQWCLRLL